MKIALFQTDIIWEDPIANYRDIESHLDQLTEAVDLMVLPETFTTGFSMNVKKFADDPIKGIGLAFVNHGGGFTGNGEQAVIKGVVKMKRLENGKAGL